MRRALDVLWDDRRDVGGRLVVTNSELATLRSCRAKHGFRYVNLLSGDSGERARWGTWLHLGLQHLRIGRMRGWYEPEAEGAAYTALGHAELAAIAALGQYPPEDRLAEVVEMACEVRWAVGHYVYTYRSDRDRWVILGIEAPFRVPMRGPRSGNTLATYAGVFDLVVYDVDNDDVVLIETKSTSEDLHNSSIDRRCELDAQACGYLWALDELVRGRGWSTVAWTRMPIDTLRRFQQGRMRVGRVLYDVVRSRMPTTPKLNQDGTVSVAAIDTTAELYRSAILAQQRPEKMKPERWAEVQAKQAEILARLEQQGERYVRRVEWHRSEDDIARWEGEVLADLPMLRAQRERSNRTRNSSHCCSAWSMPCEYRDVCVDGDDHGLRVRDHRHEEVAEAEAAAKAAGEVGPWQRT